MKKSILFLCSLLSVASPVVLAYSCKSEKNATSRLSQINFVEFKNELSDLQKFVNDIVKPAQNLPLEEDLVAASSKFYSESQLDKLKTAAEKSSKFTDDLYDKLNDTSLFNNAEKYNYGNVKDSESKEDVYNLLEYSLNLQESFLNTPSSFEKIDSNTQWRSSIFLSNLINNLEKLTNNEQYYREERNSVTNSLNTITRKYVSQSFDFLVQLVTNQKLVGWDSTNVKTIYDTYVEALKVKFTNFINNSDKEKESKDSAAKELEKTSKILKNSNIEQIENMFKFFLNPFTADSFQSSSADSFIANINSYNEFNYNVFYYPVFLKLKDNNVDKDEIYKSVNTIKPIPKTKEDQYFSIDSRAYLDGIIYFNNYLNQFNNIFGDSNKLEPLKREQEQKISDDLGDLWDLYEDDFSSGKVTINVAEESLDTIPENYEKLSKKLLEEYEIDIKKYEYNNNELSLILVKDFYNKILNAFKDEPKTNSIKKTTDLRPVSNPNFFKYKYEEDKSFIDKIEEATSEVVDKFTILLQSWMITSGELENSSTSPSLLNVILQYLKPANILDIIYFMYEALKTLYFEKTDDYEKAIYFSLLIQNKFQARLNEIISGLFL